MIIKSSKKEKIGLKKDMEIREPETAHL